MISPQKAGLERTETKYVFFKATVVDILRTTCIQQNISNSHISLCFSTANSYVLPERDLKRSCRILPSRKLASSQLLTHKAFPLYSKFPQITKIVQLSNHNLIMKHILNFSKPLRSHCSLFPSRDILFHMMVVSINHSCFNVVLFQQLLKGDINI